MLYPYMKLELQIFRFRTPSKWWPLPPASLDAPWQVGNRIIRYRPLTWYIGRTVRENLKLQDSIYFSTLSNGFHESAQRFESAPQSGRTTRLSRLPAIINNFVIAFT